MKQEQNSPTHEDDSVIILQDIIDKLLGLAEQHQQDNLFLLSLLRDLESLHRKIRIEMFETSLPETRNDLYQLVKEIEEQGGWPYIERMRLQHLLQKLQGKEEDVSPVDHQQI